GLARGRMKPKQAALVEALTGRFDGHHAELTRMLLDQIDALATQIGTLTTRIDELLTALEPQARADEPDTRGGAGAGADGARESTTIQRLDEIPGISPGLAQIILAEIGLDMSRFPTAAHLVSWAKLCPRTIQSGAIQRSGKTGTGNPYLKGALGQAAAAAAKTNTSANATGASSNAAANSRRSSLSPARSWSSSGTCSTTPPPRSGGGGLSGPTVVMASPRPSSSAPRSPAMSPLRGSGPDSRGRHPRLHVPAPAVPTATAA